jgi:4'-phosphopantetheinyl transferase EntD
MIETLLPTAVVVEELFEDPPAPPLFPAEEAVIAQAVERRRREFATVRLCARRALARLGHAPVAVLPGSRGEPQWPPGIVGSMTHCIDYRACALARRHALWTVGIDAEPHDALPYGVLDAIARPEEQRDVARCLADRPEVRWDRLLFSAKEATYKAWFPLARRWLGFEDARISIDPAGAFRVELLVAGPVIDGAELSHLSGRWTIEAGLALTAVAHPRR